MGSPEPHPAERLRRYLFGDFTLDLDRGVLLRGSEEVALRPKSFEVLTCLVEHHGRLLSKTALIEAVWPETTVTDNSLPQCLVEIRRALGDDSQQLIRTVARRGYLFAAPVTSPVLAFPRQPAVAPVAPPRPWVRRLLSRKATLAGLVLAACAAVLLLLYRPARPPSRDLAYTQLTNFTDSAVVPALSPDGRMLAFYRSDSWWLTGDQIYVKLLPHGEPRQITHDPRPKYGLAFSPDGSRIAYTVSEHGQWNTYTVSPLGGEPSLLLANAGGLSWFDERRVLFSEIATGVHMGIVMAAENRSEHRTLYFPRDERGMAHYSYASPDRKWALVVEMDPVWQPCRLVPLDGGSAGRQVGPAGKCTAAAWSPDGKWMYFGAEVDGNRHLWRQRFPHGKLEQITSGLTEETGIAVAPGGRSLITSIGMEQGEVWIHDARGERCVSCDGYVSTAKAAGLFGASPVFSRDGKSLFYLRRESPGAAIELWRMDLAARRSEIVLPGFSILEYDVSDDAGEVVFSTQPAGKDSELWLAKLDRSAPPKRIAAAGETSPHFGPDGQILFRLSDGKTHYAARMNRDGRARARVVPYPIGNVVTVSPDRRWIVSIMPAPDGGRGTMAVPVAGGAPRRICASGCSVFWAPDGRFLYVEVQRASRTEPGKTLAIPVPPGETFPNLPASGIRGLTAGAGLPPAAAFPGSRVVAEWNISPGTDPSVFAYVKSTVHRNLFRIPLPD